MKQRKTGWEALLRAVLCALLCLALSVSAADTGVEQDEDGGIWDYDAGIYTDPSGKTHPITPGGVEEGTESSTSVSEQSGDGGLVVGTESDPEQNEDGSITVESGQIQAPSEEATRAPLEGDAWQALLDSIAARNGSETPTVWTNPATGETVPVEVVYMGIGRSMILVDDRRELVNTVDLKWQTEAPEDRVLATVSSKYVWLRKKPSNEITNPKFMQVYRDSVFRVLGTNKNWTFVDYNGTRAYVATGALEFFYNDHTDFEAGYVSVKGKMKGSDSVQLRARANMGILEQHADLGTPVTVFDIQDNVAEIDVEGKHCLIKAEFITLARDLITED